MDQKPDQDRFVVLSAKDLLEDIVDHRIEKILCGVCVIAHEPPFSNALL